MTTEMVNKVKEMDDFKVVKFFNFFNEKLFEGMEVTNKEVMEGIPASIENLPGFERITNLSPEERQTQLEATESAAIARTVLVNMAQDTTLSPLMEKTLENYSDDELMVGAILAIGAAASMIILAATTEFKGKIGGIEFHKKEASPELVKNILDPFTNVLPKIQ